MSRKGALLYSKKEKKSYNVILFCREELGEGTRGKVAMKKRGTFIVHHKDKAAEHPVQYFIGYVFKLPTQWGLS